MSQNFFQMYRKRGFSLTLEILRNFKKKEAKEPDFFQALKDNNSYLNEFYRSKDDLLNNKLIAYKLNADYEKVICITEKGLTVLEKLEQINGLLSE